MLSSEPDTIHLPPVTEKLAKMQYFSLRCPEYILRHYQHWRAKLSKSSSNSVISHNLLCPCYSPKVWVCCRGLPPRCTCRWSRIWRTTPAGCHRRWVSSNTVLMPCPRCDWKINNLVLLMKMSCQKKLTTIRRNLMRQLTNRRDWNEPPKLDLNAQEVFWDIFLFWHPKFEPIRQTVNKTEKMASGQDF